MFKEWLIAALKRSKLSQAELARRMTAELGRSIDRAAVNKMTKEGRAIDAEELLAIMRITGAGLPSAFGDLLASRAEQSDEDDVGGLSELQARAVLIAGQAVLGWMAEHPIFQMQLTDPANLSFAARLIAQIARSRRFHEQVARGDEAALEAARLALELQHVQ